jgi:hypothetical protein
MAGEEGFEPSNAGIKIGHGEIPRTNENHNNSGFRELVVSAVSQIWRSDA